MVWYKGPFCPSKLWNRCGRVLLSSESRTNIWTKLHCCFFGHAGLLMASTYWPSLASQFKLYNVIILLQAATWSLMIAPKMGLQTLLQQIWFNHLQTFFFNVPPTCRGHWSAPQYLLSFTLERALHEGREFYACFTLLFRWEHSVYRKKKMLILLCNLWRNVKGWLHSHPQISTSTTEKSLQASLD